MTSRCADALIVGGGLAGLSAAWRLRQRGLSDVRVLEASERVGGCVRTVSRGGRLYETGPNSLRGSCPAIRSMLGPLGLGADILEASAAASERWLWLPRGLTQAPRGPADLLRSPALSRAAKARLLAEPLRRPWRLPVERSTIAGFLADRLGAEAFEAFGAPVTTGIFAGDPEGIGVEAFAPLAIAARAGGLLRGMGAIRATSGGSNLWTLSAGLSSLTDALGTSVTLELGARVVAWEPRGDGLSVRLADGSELRTRRLVLAVPSGALSTLLSEPSLSELPAVSVASVSVALSERHLQRPPSGFGLLVSRLSPRAPVLGMVFASRIFAGRAPEGEVIITAICGGGRHPDAARQRDAELLEGVLEAIDGAFGLRGAPEDSEIARWAAAIPQIPPGYLSRARRLRDGLPPGVTIAGSVLGGVSLEQVAASGLAAADRVSAR